MSTFSNFLLAQVWTMSRRVRSQQSSEEMSLRILAQLIAIQKERKEDRLELPRQFEIQQQYDRTNTKNMGVLIMSNPTRNFAGGMRNLGLANNNRNHNNRAGDRDIVNTIAEHEIREANANATLGRCPKSLYDLWNELEFGHAGRKAAKKFNSAERGNKHVKYNHSKQKPFWVLVNDLCNCGHTATAAINLINEVW